jgi:hypothetical protein
MDIKYYLNFDNSNDDDVTLVKSSDLGRLIQFMQEMGIVDGFMLSDKAGRVGPFKDDDYTDLDVHEGK